MTELVVVGAGGHGREVFDAATAAARAGTADWDVVGFVDDGDVDLGRLERLGVALLGDLGALLVRPTAYAIGVGTPEVRARLAARLSALPADPATVVHPGAHIGPDVELGEGVVVFDRTTITTDVRIGRHTHLNVGCAVQHDTVVGDFVQFSPGVFVNGDCVLGDHVFLGTGAIVTRGCTVGAGARVGAGAVVLADVEPGTTVVGVPARPH
ncbi:NeuD/PglB/VioB family sugar acetyltransferase [Dermatobacter hominis]|uniref:NeuD/PglB/VioB family sugar acetyltransferase n=1 Tax=Dermatobacter hominis TaxID=2884263 RepID=UPI001D100C79|nr:NeuD/PglB/VioB family sugar acetyltransferase [Dermatobacter hominis]UDY33933.1 NeuD/PglB/VioB family sugar acetyltransferase [Dermatobacter hominis]